MSDPRTDAALRRAEHIQRQLDEALAATFPASDPVSIVSSHHEEDGGAAPALDSRPGENQQPKERGTRAR